MNTLFSRCSNSLWEYRYFYLERRERFWLAFHKYVTNLEVQKMKFRDNAHSINLSICFNSYRKLFHSLISHFEILVKILLLYRFGLGYFYIRTMLHKKKLTPDPQNKKQNKKKKNKKKQKKKRKLNKVSLFRSEVIRYYLGYIDYDFNFIPCLLFFRAWKKYSCWKGKMKNVSNGNFTKTTILFYCFLFVFTIENQRILSFLFSKTKKKCLVRFFVCKYLSLNQ